MHPDLEKLIRLALSDGIISEKEREIILGKADELGVDKYEASMYIEMCLSDSHQNETKLRASKTIKHTKRDFTPKAVKHLKPAKLIREAQLTAEIKELEESDNELKKEAARIEKKLASQRKELKHYVIKDELSTLKNTLATKKYSYVQNLLAKANPILKRELQFELRNEERVIKEIIKINPFSVSSETSYWLVEKLEGKTIWNDCKSKYICYINIITFGLFGLFVVIMLQDNDLVKAVSLLAIGIIMFLLVVIRFRIDASKGEGVKERLGKINNNKKNYLRSDLREIDHELNEEYTEIQKLEIQLRELKLIKRPA
jgi:ribosomal protein L32E